MKKTYVIILGVLTFIGVVGSAFAYVANIPMPWEPRERVWLIASMSCETERDRVWRRQDYLDEKMKEAGRERKWQVVLERKEQIREQKKIERKINRICERYDKKK